MSKRRRRILYGHLKDGKCLLSRLPPDVPVPFQAFRSIPEAVQAAKASKYDIIWCGDAKAEYERVMHQHDGIEFL